MTVAATSTEARRGLDAVSFRESYGNVSRRRENGETPEACDDCGTETDVTFPAHSPQCKNRGEAVEEKPEQKTGWYRDERGRRLNRKEVASDGSKTLSQLTREQTLREDAEPMTMRCGVAGCGWSIASTAGEGPELARAHRKEAHAWMNEKRRSAVERRTAVEDAERRAAALSEREPKAREADVGPLPAADQGRLPGAAVVCESRDPAGTEVASRSESAVPTGKRPGRPKLWTRSRLIEWIQAFAAEHGRAPTTLDLKVKGSPPWHTFKRELGSFGEALGAAGIEPAKNSGRSEAVGDQAVTSSADTYPGEAPTDTGQGDVDAFLVRPADTGRPDERAWSRRPRTREEVLDAIQRFARDHGRPPARSDFTGHTAQYVSPKVADRLFGSWSDAVVAAGFPRPTNVRRDAWTRESAIAALQKAVEELGRTPLCDETHAGLPGVSAYRRIFGAWSDYVEAAGFERPGHGSRPDGIVQAEEASDEEVDELSTAAPQGEEVEQAAGALPVAQPSRPAVSAAPDLEAVREATLHAVNAFFALLDEVEATVKAAAK